MGAMQTAIPRRVRAVFLRQPIGLEYGPPAGDQTLSATLPPGAPILAAQRRRRLPIGPGPTLAGLCVARLKLRPAVAGPLVCEWLPRPTPRAPCAAAPSVPMASLLVGRGPKHDIRQKFLFAISSLKRASRRGRSAQSPASGGGIVRGGV
eukprot:scaffold5028_cov381-Prasinococcus_capsulatus_cf.AAC.2